jgi:hypothetical protein
VILTEGQHIIADRYQLTAQIGCGGVGVVWRAWDMLLDREVAVKEIMRPEAAGPETSAEVHERTLREARAAARIRHSGAAAVYDVISEAGRPYIVMELIEGRSLAQVIEEDGPLALAKVADIGCQVLAALTAGHAAGVLHRDLKPANVIVTASGRAVLTDFGIASVSGNPSMTQAGVVWGTPCYLAPERARGEPATPETDMWSLGATLYAAVSGRGPYDGHEGVPATLAAILNQEAPELVGFGPLPDLIRALMDHDPRRRPSPAETAQVLAEAAGDSSWSAASRRVIPAQDADGAVPNLALVPPDRTPDVAPEGSSGGFLAAVMTEVITDDDHGQPRSPAQERRPRRSGHGRWAIPLIAGAAVAVIAAAVLVLHRPAHHPAAAHPAAVHPAPAAPGFAAIGTPVAAVQTEFRVTATTGPDGSPVLLARARDGALMANRLTSGSWSGWTSLPGGKVYTGIPAVLKSRGDGRLFVVARTASGRLAFLWQSAPGSGSWNGPVALGWESTSSDPTMVQWPDGHLEVFVRLGDGSLGTTSQLGATVTSGWSAWSSLGGSLAGPPAVALDSSGDPQVFAVSSYGSLMRKYFEDGAWQSWEALPGGYEFTGVPAVGTNFDGRLEVFARTSSGALVHVWQIPRHPDLWGGPAVLLAGVTGDPSAYSTVGGRIEAFAAALDGSVRHTWQVQVRAGTSWSQPASIGGDSASAPVPVRSVRQSEVFVRTPDGAIAWIQQNASMSWSDWSSLGGSF